jgi:hypothetical protein
MVWLALTSHIVIEAYFPVRVSGPTDILKLAYFHKSEYKYHNFFITK